jgi:hypothetical protein
MVTIPGTRTRSRSTAKHPIGSKAWLALALGIHRLQRRSDVIKMGRQHIGRGEVIKVRPYVVDKWLRSMRQQKTVGRTGAQFHLPVFPKLREILDATATENLTFLVTKTGKPYSAGDFPDQFRKWCDEAGLPKRCTFHGLRKYSNC